MKLSPDERNRLFMVVSYCRSGTHMIRSALSQHPQVTCWGEIFIPDNFPKHSWPLDVAPAAHIRNVVLDSGKRRVGFCIQGYPKGSPVTKHWPDIWKEFKGFRLIIRLHRRNLFERAVSHWFMRVGRLGHAYCQEEVDTICKYPARRIPLWWFRQDFPRTLRDRQIIDRLFPRALHVYYEDFVKDMQGTMTLVQRFLEVEPMVLEPQSMKPPLTMREQVLNYDQIKQAYAETRYAEFFTE